MHESSFKSLQNVQTMFTKSQFSNTFSNRAYHSGIQIREAVVVPSMASIVQAHSVFETCTGSNYQKYNGICKERSASTNSTRIPPLEILHAVEARFCHVKTLLALRL